ncbi:MAG: hypothetical protein Q8M03_12950 [Legionella sp.]|nr:hypothetical protein [Legionella sp.]
MKNIFTIVTVEKDKAVITFPANSSEHAIGSNALPTIGCTAAATLLDFALHMERGDDYTIANSEGFESTGWKNKMTINGRVNVILALDFLLKTDKQFSLRTTDDKDKNYWNSRVNLLIVNAINDKASLSAEDYERLAPLFNKTLDKAYTELCAEPGIKVLNLIDKINRDYENLLHHPYFQLLGLCFEDQQQKIATYSNLDFISRLRAKKPDENFTSEIGKKYLKSGLIPQCYVQNNGIYLATVDFNKISSEMKSGQSSAASPVCS